MVDTALDEYLIPPISGLSFIRAASLIHRFGFINLNIPSLIRLIPFLSSGIPRKLRLYPKCRVKKLRRVLLPAPLAPVIIVSRGCTSSWISLNWRQPCSERDLKPVSATSSPAHLRVAMISTQQLIPVRPGLAIGGEKELGTDCRFILFRQQDAAPNSCTSH